MDITPAPPPPPKYFLIHLLLELEHILGQSIKKQPR